MKTIMFAGADAMTDLNASRKAIQLPEVFEQLNKFGLIKNLEKSIINMTQNPFPAMMASVLTQVGLYQRYIKKNPINHILAGCSLGDLAKLICADVVSTELVAEGLELFCKGLKDVPAGAILQVRTKVLRDMNFLKSLEDFNIYLAMDQTSQHCLIAGENENLAAWQSQSTYGQEVAIRPLFPFPLHSPLMQKPYQNLEKILFEGEMKHPTRALVSSTDATLLADPNAIRLDLQKNILGQVKWQETYTWLADKVKVSEFISIGPIGTLKHFGERIFTNRKVTVVDSMDETPTFSEIACLV